MPVWGEVQGLVDGDVDMVDGKREEHYGMDVDGPAPGEDFRFDEDEEEEEKIHRLVVKSTPNGSSSSGKKVPATSSPSKPPFAAGKPTAGKSLVKLVPVAIPSKMPMKNKANAKELPVKAAQVKLAEEGKEVIPAKSKSGPTCKTTSTRTHEEQQEEEAEVEVTPAVKPKSKAGASYEQKTRPSPHHLLLVVRSVHAVPVHFLWVVVEKRCLGWYMRGVGYVLGASGGLRGTGPVQL